MPRYRITAKTPLTDRISAFSLVPEDGALPDWRPGAHVNVETTAGTRSYSLISWPDEIPEALRITVQREEDGEGGSRAMHAYSVGGEVTLSDPKNDFELSDAEEPVLLLAGGIGVTPIISMATALQAAGRPFAFHYAGRSAGVMAYLDRIRETFGATAHFDDETPLDLPSLMRAHADHRLYVCGPKGMIDAARSAAEQAGIPADRVHVELFTTPAARTEDKAFEVEVSSTGEVFTIPPGKSIIEVLEEGGVDLIYDCQRGDCGICQTEVLEGTPDHRDVVLSQAERDSGKVMQICVSRALSDRLVLDL